MGSNSDGICILFRGIHSCVHTCVAGKNVLIHMAMCYLFYSLKHFYIYCFIRLLEPSSQILWQL